MNELKEINGKYYQECSVVMLATDKVSNIGVCKKTMSDVNIGKLEYFNSSMFISLEYWTPQHLYFLSNEEIKDERVLYNNLEKQIIDYRDQPASPKSILGRSYMGYCKKIIATTDTSLELPQPPKSFIQAYIKAYNENKPITKVLVEYNIFNKGYTDKSDIPYQECYRLKINSSNEITIKKIKDSYTREEVVVISLKMQHDYSKYKENCHYGPNMREIAEWTDNWLEENL